MYESAEVSSKTFYYKFYSSKFYFIKKYVRI